MEAPRGVEVSASQGTLQISGRKDLQLESTEGEVRKNVLSSLAKVLFPLTPSNFMLLFTGDTLPEGGIKISEFTVKHNMGGLVKLMF